MHPFPNAYRTICYRIADSTDKTCRGVISNRRLAVVGQISSVKIQLQQYPLVGYFCRCRYFAQFPLLLSPSAFPAIHNPLLFSSALCPTLGLLLRYPVLLLKANRQYILLFIFNTAYSKQKSSKMLNMPPKSPPASLPSQSGKKIKNYVYHYCDLIGKGNFARVYRGLNTTTQEVVAIKIVSLDALKSKRLEELIFQEIRILQQMNHPNVVKFHEALLSDRNCYIVTELCNEGDLEDRLRRKKPPTENELNRVILDLYHGLRYLREMGVTHRDLKSANIFMHNGVAKIADFGLAKFYKERFKDLDIGSPLYMSPEGLIYNYYGEKTDIWAFGIIIYELLHGETPFCHCLTEVELKNSAVKPIPQHKFKKNIHPQLRQLINSLLEINELKRPTAHDLANDPYIKSLLFHQQNNENLKKRPFERPVFSQTAEGLLNTGLMVRPGSQPSPMKNTNVNKSIEQPNFARTQVKKEERKISFQSAIQPKPIELGGNKTCLQLIPKQNLPPRFQEHPNMPRPRSTRPEEHRSRITVTYSEHPHLLSSHLRQRQFSEKTIETKESEQDRAYFLRGEYLPRPFDN